MQTMPDYDQSLLQFINTVDPCLVLVHALLHGTPNFVIHGVQVRAVGGGGQSSGDTNQKSLAVAPGSCSILLHFFTGPISAGSEETLFR